MENIFEELGIPKKYLKPTDRDDRHIALVHRTWLKSLIKHSHLSEFIEKGRFETWSFEEEPNPAWIKIFVRVCRKRDAKVLPLPRVRTVTANDPALTFSQLLQYVSQTNYKNLWKAAYKKYCSNSENAKDTRVVLADYNQVLREIITRTYGCPIINTSDSNMSTDISGHYEAPCNILPVICAVETLNAIFLLHIPYIEHNLNDCVTFSPAILDNCYTNPLFIVYQLLETLKSLHDRSLTLGDVTISDIYLSEDLWIQIFPQLSSNIYVQDVTKNDVKKSSGSPVDCEKFGHKYTTELKCENCGIKTYDRVQVTNESLDKLCQLWVDGLISNFTYLTALNNFSGRKFGDPNCHHVFPWITDFSSRCGKNWRDLKKSKYRLNKGDRQLDLTYENSQTQVAHHVSDVLSSITYYVYMARRNPKSVLCKNVRTVWVPAEYPSSIQRMQEWTPDECIPEFFNDPTVFKSIHDDLDDLEVPPWSSSPEDFVEKHREALESTHVSERLHHWIDLTFGYKLGGQAAVKAKNVCLHLVDGHMNLTKSGIAQLFTCPHPPRSTSSLFWAKSPPKIYVHKNKTRDHSSSSSRNLEVSKSDDELILEEGTGQTDNRSPLTLSRFLSRSRSSLNEEPIQKQARSPSNQRSASLGPKNPTFTSHVTSKLRHNQFSVPPTTLSTGIIFLPKEYKPEFALENLERLHMFFSKTFHPECKKSFVTSSSTVDNTASVQFQQQNNGRVEEDIVQNAFTNKIFTKNFEAALKRNKSEQNVTSSKKIYGTPMKNENQIICNYSEIIAARRIRELQVLGCLIVEIFMAKQLRLLGVNNYNCFDERLKACLVTIKSNSKEIPFCIKYVVNLLMQPESIDLGKFKYPSVTDFGLPPPSAHLLLEPLLHCVIPFSKHFSNLYRLITSLKEFKNVSEELNILYHFDCNGHMCAEYETIERTKILFAQNISECKVKLCARNLEVLLMDVNTTTDAEVINILIPFMKNLLKYYPTSVLAAWYLFDPVARVLGINRTTTILLESVLKLYENELNQVTVPNNSKIAKLYHHSFLLRLIVRFGLKCFLENFVTPLVEAVGGYRDYEKVDFILHNHMEKIVRKTSNLKMIQSEQSEMSPSDDSSVDSMKNNPSVKKKDVKDTSEPEVFHFESEQMQNGNEPLKTLMEHLEYNASSDLPFNHSTAEEALDATITENIDQLRNLEELNLNLNEEYCTEKPGLMSPTIPIPSSVSQNDFNNISCDIGSRNSDGEYMFERELNPSHFDVVLDSPNASGKEVDHPYSISSDSSSTTGHKGSVKTKSSEVKISDMSSDSLVWLSHRLGPVLTARYLSRNLLKMLTLCYVGGESLTSCSRNDLDGVSIASGNVIGDQNAYMVLNCLTTIAGLYGEQLILLQYLPHISELIALCKKKLTPNLEGGLISCLALLKYIIPYLSDSALMDQLQDVILKSILHPIVRLLGSTKYSFPNTSIARSVLARKYLDALYVLSLRVGADMTKTHLIVPGLQRFFLIFDKVHCPGIFMENNEKDNVLIQSLENSTYVEVRRDGTTAEWAVGGQPLQISHVRVKECESMDSLSPPPSSQITLSGVEDTSTSKALEELQSVFTPELAHTAYIPFMKLVGLNSLEISLKNHTTIRNLCQEYEKQSKSCYPNLTSDFQLNDFGKNYSSSCLKSDSIGSNISLIGNRIDVQSENTDTKSDDLLNLVSKRMDNTSRHLRGNWLAYWEHEIGRSDKDTMFNFKQIKLQTFASHTHSVKSLYVLDNENSFISGSRDKTVKLWSLRSQGDGTSVTGCQWTYTAHKKSILAVTFVESLRLVASCDSIVHIWDPFMGASIGHLESSKYLPVNVLKCMPAPSTLIFASTTDGTVKLIDARLCAYVHELKVTLNLGGLIRCLAIPESGLWLAAGQSSGYITVIDTRTGLVLATWRAHEGEVLQLAAYDENTLISSSLDQNISVWNVQDGKFKFHMKGATEPVHCLRIYNTELISGTTANRIGVHTSIAPNTSFSSTRLRSDAFKGLLTSMAILPLNRLLLLGADNGNISLLC